MSKFKHFTHTDLDAVGCAIAMYSLLGRDRVDTTYCDYSNVNERITEFLDGDLVGDYEYIFITDISVNEEVAALLDAVNESDTGPFVQLLDHHGTAKWLGEKYEWAFVEEELRARPGHKSSGTSLVLDFFEVQRPGFGVKPSPNLRRLLEQIRRYDTWEWHDIYDDEGPKDLNDLLYLIGRPDFVEARLNSIQNDDGLTFTETEYVLLNQRKKEIADYINRKDKQLIKVVASVDEEGNDQYTGVVFAESHISELGNELCKRNPDIDYIGIIDAGAMKISFRTVKDIDVSAIAKRLGGGGHPKAAGAPIKQEAITEFLRSI